MKKLKSQIDKQDRRSFFWKAGTVVSAAMASSTVAASTVINNDTQDLKTQLLQLQVSKKLRQLHQRYISLMNSGAYEEMGSMCVANFQQTANDDSPSAFHTQVVLEQNDELDSVTVAADGLSAEAKFHGKVRIETLLKGNSSSLYMARQQGQGARAQWESGFHQISYIKIADSWFIKALKYQKS